jgi:hypothetical protein
LVAADVVSPCGGWPALAELMASAGADPRAEADGSGAAAYLWEEVLAELPPRRRRLLALILALGGADDELLSAGSMPVVQWHFDAITQLPPDAELLGTSDKYNQAFRVGEVAWGLQFHVEATMAMVETWADKDAVAIRATGREPADLVSQVRFAERSLSEVGETLAQRFAKLVTG